MNFLNISKSSVGFVCDFPSEHTGRIVKLALAAMQPSSPDLSRPLDKLAVEKSIPKPQLYELLSVYIKIIKLFIHSTDKDFANILSDAGFSNEFINNLPFVGNRDELINAFFAPHFNDFQNLSSVKWRIDISLLHSSICLKALPNIILSIKLKDGKSYTIQLNIRAFHTLRFNIALILKEMKMLKHK